MTERRPPTPAEAERLRQMVKEMRGWTHRSGDLTATPELEG